MSRPALVSTANWGLPPHNRWSFQHVQELFPTCRLARGHGASLELPFAGRDILATEFASPSGGQLSLRSLLDRACCDAFLLVHGGRLVAEHYLNGMGPASPHLLNSISKTFVGMLAGIAVGRRELDPLSPVTRYLPELDNAGWRAATVRNLLDMTAGVRFAEDYADPQTDFWRESAVVGWRPAPADDPAPGTLLEFARSLNAQDMAHGEKFQYRTVCTNVLGMVLERAMGARLGTLLETRIWSRLRTEHDAAIVVDAAGFPYVGAGMNTTARDLARFGLMMISGGVVEGAQVVPSEWIADTVSGATDSKALFARGSYGEVMPGWHYRNQVWVASSDPAVMLAIGIHGQILYMDKAGGLVIVMLSSQPEALDLAVYMDMLTALGTLGQVLAA